MIRLVDYSKTLRGRCVLDHLNYEFEEGHIYGLYGRNGSGKTMILRAISGLIHATEGYCEINGEVVHKDMDFAKDTGIIIETLSLDPDLSARKNLEVLAKIQNKATSKDIEDSLRNVGLDPFDKRHVRAYSLGMKQKLNIAQAIFEQQKILLLDEPTNALDNESVEEIYHLLNDLKNEGRLIIIASHIREDLEKYCDTIIHVENGKMEDLKNEKNI